MGIHAFARALQSKLLDCESRIGKEYLKLLINEISINGNEVQISGSYAVLAGVIAESNEGSLRVPTFAPNWLTSSKSNILK